MEKPRDLWQELCSYENLELAYRKARKHKTTKDYVIEFKENLEENLLLLRSELLLHCYKPKPLVNFVIHDPKVRKISKSHFRDRIVHHALCNVIEPIFDKSFIYDSYANRKGKGTLKAIERFDCFKRKTSRNNSKLAFVLKADIRRYFETVDHKILLNLIERKIEDQRIIWLVRQILHNHRGGKGMPLGNLTSQFFANIYLNELDCFVKHKLKAKYYLRYVDDFVVLNSNKDTLERQKEKIGHFLKQNLSLALHPEKSKTICLNTSLNFLGFRIFYHYKLLRKSNLRSMKGKFEELRKGYLGKTIDYDVIYDFLEGWLAYTRHANTYKLRMRFASEVEAFFPNEISTKEISRASRQHCPAT